MKLRLAVLGAIIGLALGLYYAWQVDPVEYTDNVPAALMAEDKMGYMQLVALAYRADGDVERARQRLVALGESAPGQAVTALAQRMAASGGDTQTVSALAALAVALGTGPAGPTPEDGAATGEIIATALPEPSPTLPPVATPQLLPTRPPSPTPPGLFVYVGKQALCDPAISPPLLQVITQNAQGDPIPGVEVLVEWNGGFDRFFTGLKPELGAGYGDFTMEAEQEYTVRLANDPQSEVAGLRSELCVDPSGKSFPSSLQLLFRQPP
jgi:hypothetical protein